ncbi:hypothetical protein [Pararhizobium sp.]|uniref:hypothetical protein n=1 Tax=Pararhizobium sp. TaxID=1977563 RepID=UPI0027215350|nr:hypothetical protein [Pararhizobium sp.]MDO9418758.1 hypothetical protein [Pararhizobium sp.]
MIQRTVALCLVLLAIAVQPAAAQSDEDVDGKIEQLLGSSEGFADSFKLLTEAMRYGDPVTVADLAEYPLTVHANGEVYDLQSAKDLLDNYDTLITQATQTAVAEQEYSDLFINGDGVMFARGAVWMTLVCEDDACEQSHWAINAINN